MSDQARMFVIGVVSLIIGAAGGWWYGMLQVDGVTLKLMTAIQEKDQAMQSADRLRKTNHEAAVKYGKDLGKLVTAAGAPAAAAAQAISEAGPSAVVPAGETQRTDETQRTAAPAAGSTKTSCSIFQKSSMSTVPQSPFILLV